MMKKKTPKKHSQQAQGLMDVMQATVDVLGPRTRGVYLVLPAEADAPTIRRALRAAQALTALLRERLTAVT